MEAISKAVTDHKEIYLDDPDKEVENFLGSKLEPIKISSNKFKIGTNTIKVSTVREKLVQPTSIRKKKKSYITNGRLNRAPKIVSFPPSNNWMDTAERCSAFTPYKINGNCQNPTQGPQSTTLLTNLTRGNTQTHSFCPKPEVINLYQKAGQGELTYDILMQEGNIFDMDDNGLTLMMWAAGYGQAPVVQLLINNGHDLNTKGCDGITALLLASSKGHLEVVQCLLQNGAHVDHCDDFGSTALMHACHENHPNCVRELLEHGADITLSNIVGDTAFDIAVANHSFLAQVVLEDYLLSLLDSS